MGRMRLGLCQSSLPKCDGEGYPVSTELVSEPPRAPSKAERDGESGEWLRENIIVLRRSTKSDSDQIDLDHLQLVLLHEQLYFRGFGREDLEFIKGEIGYSICYGSNVHSMSKHNLNMTKQHNTYDDGGGKRRRRFKVPAEYLPNTVSEKRDCNFNKIIYISIWQEFIYGPPIMMLQKYCLTREELRGITDISSSLSQFVHKNIVDIFLYTFFFGVYFVSCCIFSNILELVFYIVYGGHLCIHQLGSKSNVNLCFSGSIFQGPAYILIRFFCKHCTQKENAKVMRHHMKKMKRDIIGAKVS